MASFAFGTGGIGALISGPYFLDNLLMDLSPSYKKMTLQNRELHKYMRRAEKSTGVFVCFVKGTKVYTPVGFINIEDIKKGEQVFSRNMETKELEYSSVIKTNESKDSIFYKILIGAEEIEVTSEHPFYCANKGWVKAKDLMQGDNLMNATGETVPITLVNKMF